MAGKKKTTNTKTENRGGRRPGAGRKLKKPANYDEEYKQLILRFLNEIEAETGEHPIKQALRMMGDKKTMATARAGVFKQVSEMFTVKKTERKEEINVKQGPRIGLPPRRNNGKDPALEVLKGGK